MLRNLNDSNLDERACIESRAQRISSFIADDINLLGLQAACQYIEITFSDSDDERALL